jgi:hypothetical protein
VTNTLAYYGNREYGRNKLYDTGPRLTSSQLDWLYNFVRVVNHLLYDLYYPARLMNSIQKKENKTFTQSYKTFYSRNLQIFVIS